ncbi:Solitary outer membrane autotransporter beta-barrel domain [Vibrio rarus]|uniref:Solitary outer membrane autotransporter beta-barrel domain n=1 Tax=Vibrio rarus TaxID=413403 RepID=UPI0021C29E90|nr:Solitary outer membrane autotransporter beta-barrel domain [Vibrio rarus]
MKRYLVFLVTMLICLTSHADPVLRKVLEQNFATAVLLSDSEAISFGFQDFDPNSFITTDNDNIGSEESLELRKQIAIYTIPYTIKLHDVPLKGDQVLQQNITFVGSYLKTKRDIAFGDTTIEPEDTSVDQTFTLSGKYWVNYPLTENLSLNSGLDTNFMHYRNDYTYRNSFTLFYKDQLEGRAFNTNAWAVTFKPSAELHYTKEQDWGHWEAFTEMKYFYGVGWGEANEGDVGNPEGWYWINGIKGFYDVTHWGGYGQTLFSSIRRIDIGKDLQEPMGTTSYYEWSAGWLVSPPYFKDFIDNIGLGININYGSSLKGGTIVLLINEH